MHLKRLPTKLLQLIGLRILSVYCINDSHPASCPAQTCNDPNDCITSSLRCETITFQAMRRSTSSTPVGLSQGFLSRGINRFTRKASKDVELFSTVHNFLVTSMKILRKSSILSPN